MRYRMQLGDRRRVVRAAAVAIAVLASMLATTAVGAVTLTPPPPAFESCHTTGSGTICQGNRTQTAGYEPTGIICGSGPEAFELVDHGGTVLEHFTRWYDRDGNLVRRLAKQTWLDSEWVNLENGKTIGYRQSNVIVDVLSVPGDLDSATETSTGVTTFVLPGEGAMFQNSGRTVFSFDGTLEFRAGPQSFIDFFVDGDVTVIQPICDALAG